MILTLDNLAARYHCLPSEAMARGTTFDLYVLDVSAKWSQYQQDVRDGKAPAKPLPKLSAEQMKQMIQEVRK